MHSLAPQAKERAILMHIVLVCLCTWK